MEFTGDISDSEVEGVVETWWSGWVDSNLDSHIETCLENHDFAGSVDVEAKIRELLDDFTPGVHGCATARAFEEAVNGILDQRGEIVIKQNVDGITGEVQDALAEMVTKEVDKQVTIMVVNIQRGLRRLHSLDGAGGPEVAGSI